MSSPRTRLLAALVAVLIVAAGAGVVVLVRHDTTNGTPSAAGSGLPSGAPSGQRTFLYLGDSLMKGYYASTASQSWRELVTAGVHGKELATIGGPGQTVPDVLQHFGERKVGLLANTVVVELGTNDVGHKIPIATDVQDYPTLLADAKKRAAPDATLICLGAWKDPSESAAYDAAVHPLCTAAGGRWITLSDLYADTANRGPSGRPTAFGLGDDSHPNDAGHKAIAGRILKLLES